MQNKTLTKNANTISILIVFFLMMALLFRIGSAFSQPNSVPIAFASNINGDWEIYLTDSVGKLPVNLTLNPGADYYPTWAPDGTEIAFFSRRDANHEIYVMRADGTHQKRLTHHPATDKAPSWSPDGKRLAFSSNRTSYFNILGLTQFCGNKYNSLILLNHECKKSAFSS